MADKHAPVDPKLLQELIPPGFKDASGIAGFLKDHPDIEKQLPYSLSAIWDQYHTQAPIQPTPETPQENTTSEHKKGHGVHAEEQHGVDVSDVSLSDALMSNEHYRNIIENTVADWNKTHPDQKITDVFISDEDGKKIINPEITGKGEMPGKIQDIEKRATDTFTMAYGTRGLKAAQIAEKNKAYKKAVNDPAFARVQKDIKLGITSPDIAYKQFVERYPDKARAYLSFGKLPFRSNEYKALKRAIKARENELKKKREDEQKNREKQQKVWDKAYYKANGRFHFGKAKVEHGGVTAFNADIANKLNEAITNKQLADQKQGISYTRDVYEKQLRAKVRKEQVEYLFRKEPGRAEYLMRFDPTLKAEYKAWKKEQEEKAKVREKEQIDPNARYTSVHDDPRVQKLNADVKNTTEEEYQRRLEESRKGKGRWIRGIWYPDPKANYQAPDKQAIEAGIRKAKLLDFANANPNLVRDYAKKDPEFASAYKAYQEQQRQREQARKLGEKRGLLHAGKNESEGLTLGESVEKPVNLIEPSVKSQKIESSKPQPMQTSIATAPPTAAKPERFRDRIRQRFSPYQQENTPSEKPRIRSPQQVVRERATSTTSKAGKALDKRFGGISSKANAGLKNLHSKLPFPRIPTNPEDAAKKLAQQATQKALMLPQTWALIAGIILFFAILILILAVSYALFGEPEDEETPPISPTPSPIATPFPTLPPGKLTITKTGPESPDENGNITYTITIGGITSGATVTDTITGKATYVSALPEPEATAITNDTTGNLRTIQWTLSPNSGQSQTITLTVKSNQKDQYIYNVAEVESIAESSQPPAQSPNTRNEPAPPPNLTTDDFTQLMTGQGRNTNILGSEDKFVDTVFNNVGGQRNMSNKGIYEGLVREIYQKATQANINPLIPLVMWGVESNYSFNDHEYNCPVGEQSGFDQQLDCTINTLNTFMTDFESKYDGKNPVPYKLDTCTYTDPFIYAYEAFTPVCWTSDKNDNARTNFVILFKEFLGEK